SATLHTLPEEDAEKLTWDYDPASLHVDIQYNYPQWMECPRSVVVTSMIFLDDVPENRAPTVYIPGSHLQLAKRTGVNAPFQDQPQNISDLQVDDFDLAPAETVCGTRGQVAFSTTSVLHAGSKNTSDKPRKVLFATFSSAHICPNFNAGWIDRRIAYLEELEQRFHPERKHLVQSSLAGLREIAAQSS
ncbi:MAG: phytanoyl-CoA dioxygenase family protein, partial [Planctomycetes bacterium]|nr:phytanoyl-CoA dioxygenase family protein [Planctomycetota bacterium]